MKQFLFALLYRTGAINFVSWLNRKRVPILCYHSVVEGEVPPPDDPHKQHIPVSLFIEHLEYLQKNYRIISLTEFNQSRRENRALPDYSVVLTFDDGFEDFYSVAAPQLAQRGLPATIFVITDRASNLLPPNGESFLTWEEIKTLSSAGVTIGSHTCSHPNLRDLTSDEVARELCESRAAILKHVSQSEVPLSYPFGQTSKVISEVAEASGYCCAIDGDQGLNSSEQSTFDLSRTVIASDDDLATFVARVSGLTSAFSRARLRFGSRRRRTHEMDRPQPYASAQTNSLSYMSESFD
jgi:peptidoglycan/xylan/chitin deacetylase (PgdA/CDA1 family)